MTLFRAFLKNYRPETQNATKKASNVNYINTTCRFFAYFKLKQTKRPHFCTSFASLWFSTHYNFRQENGAISPRKYVTFWGKLGNFPGDSTPLSICFFLTQKHSKMKGVVGAYLRDAPQNKNANRSRCVSPRRTPQARMPPTDSREHRNRSRRRSPRCALATALFISNTETTELTEVFLSQLKNIFPVHCVQCSI